MSSLDEQIEEAKRVLAELEAQKAMLKERPRKARFKHTSALDRVYCR